MLNFITILFLRLLHPFYVSATEITFNAKTQSVEVSCRMFYDDLEHELNRINHAHVDITKPADKAQVDAMVTDYVKKHLVIKADGRVLPLKYVGFEIQEDGAWSYFEVNGVKNATVVNVHDDLLFTAHPEQINLLHVTVNNNRKSTKLDNPDADASFRF